MVNFDLNEKTKNIFRILSSKNISEQNVILFEVEHIKTLAKIILIMCDDENRVFNITFKTPVNNSKGTPHILEHSVLCGSRKYNVKDPFIELEKGSLNTFLNAMTFPDKTCYPVASPNIVDFHNLMDVYLDAVFFPNAIKNEKIFMQEGWHYEFDENDKLIVNGVVFNEMKGVFSDPDAMLEYAIISNLLSNTTYEHESGGKPTDIMDLTFDEFVKFHKKYYSPTNSITYLYGKLDYNDELLRLNEYFDKFEKENVDIDFGNKPQIKNKECIDYYNLDAEDINNRSFIARTYLVSNDNTVLNHIIVELIDYVLFGAEGAILKEKILNRGLCESISTHFESGIKYPYYNIVAKNIDVSKKAVLIKLIDDEIEKILKDGIEVDKIKAGININYFDLAEDEYGNIPKGLAFSLFSLDSYLYTNNYIEFIRYKDAFDYIKSIDLEDKNNIIYKTIRKIFIDNNNVAINILNPKRGYSLEKDKAIFDKILEKKKKLSVVDIDRIKEDIKDLKEYQKKENTKEELKCIPCVDVKDIERDKIAFNYEHKIINNIDTIITSNNDKDIIYIDLYFDISDMHKEEIYLFSVISRLLSKIDLINDDYKKFNDYVDTNTGGLSLKISSYKDKNLFKYSIKVVEDKIDVAFDILYKLFAEVVFLDKNRINVLLKEMKVQAVNSLLGSSHIASTNRALSNIRFIALFADRISNFGIAYNQFIKCFCEKYLLNSDLINDAMDLLYKKLHRKKIYFSYSANEKYNNKVIEAFNCFTVKLTKNKIRNIYSEIDEKRLKDDIEKIKDFIPFDSFDKNVKKEAIITPQDVNYCAIASKFDAEKFIGRINILKVLFNYDYLWTNIRVLGGAYGCMSDFDRRGNFAFVTYRDPNLKKTNETFLGVPKYLKEFKKTKGEIDKLIISTMGRIDAPRSVVNRYMDNVGAFFEEVTNEMYLKGRHSILDTKEGDLNKLSELFSEIDNSEYCALISENKIDEAKQIYDKVWKIEL